MSAASRPILYIATDVWLLDDGIASVATNPPMSQDALKKYIDTRLTVCLVARSLNGAYAGGPRLDADRLQIFSLGLDDKSRPLWWRAVLLVAGLWRVPICKADVAVVRVPEFVGTLFAVVARVRGAAVVANVVAETTAISGRFGPLRRVVDMLLKTLAQFVISSSAATIYVTENWLQQHLPPVKGKPTLTASNVELTPACFTNSPRDFNLRPLTYPLVLVAVGEQNSSGKGHDLLIRACRILADAGTEVQLHLLGDGAEQPNLRRLAVAEGVVDRVVFHGFVKDRRTIQRLTDDADFFVMPSRSEGLPRALVEAMARGICCLGSRVGGIPELLPEIALFDAGDAAAVAACVTRLSAAPPYLLTTLVEAQWRKAQAVADGADSHRVTQFIRSVVGGLTTESRE